MSEEEIKESIKEDLNKYYFNEWFMTRNVNGRNDAEEIKRIIEEIKKLVPNEWVDQGIMASGSEVDYIENVFIAVISGHYGLKRIIECLVFDDPRQANTILDTCIDVLRLVGMNEHMEKIYAYRDFFKECYQKEGKVTLEDIQRSNIIQMCKEITEIQRKLYTIYGGEKNVDFDLDKVEYCINKICEIITDERVELNVNQECQPYIAELLLMKGYPKSLGRPVENLIAALFLRFDDVLMEKIHESKKQIRKYKHGKNHGKR